MERDTRANLHTRPLSYGVHDPRDVATQRDRQRERVPRHPASNPRVQMVHTDILHRDPDLTRPW